ncbi:DUF6671 family protein [Lysobacter xanthus]
MNAVRGLAPAALYAGRRVALLTQHGKEAILAPVLEPALGCRIDLVTGYDTDLLGTFTRDIPREGTQLQAARRKARIGMELGGARIGLASEGAFGTDPMFGLLPWNVEIVIWIDDTLGIEVVGRAAGKARFATRRVTCWAEAEDFARQCDFPAHGLVARPDSAFDRRVHKDIVDLDGLRHAFDAALAESSDGYVVLDVDARAHRNPTRQGVIREAALDLAARLASCCPACDAPGFAVARREPGRPCADCGGPTSDARAEVQACVRCAHHEVRPLGDGPADPAHCPGCNP